MRVIPFKIPSSHREAFRLQTDDLPHFYDKLHQHPEIQITWIIRSEGTLIAGDYIGKFGPGDVFIFGANLPHVFQNDRAYYTGEKKEKASSISVYFNEAVWGDGFWNAPEAAMVAAFLRGCSNGFRLTGKKGSETAGMLRQLSGKKGFAGIILFLQILHLVSRGGKSLHPLSRFASHRELKEPDGQRMNEIIRFTLRESHRPVSLKEVAAVANMAPEAFCRYFKERTRKTYTGFLNEIRVSNACRLLGNEEGRSKSDIAYTVGFNNLSHFNRLFKRITGKTPGGYEKGLKTGQPSNFLEQFNQ